MHMYMKGECKCYEGRMNYGLHGPSYSNKVYRSSSHCLIVLQYFTNRLKDSQTNGERNLTANATVAIADRNVLESKFNNVMTLCAMVPLLIFTCLNSFLHQR